MRCLKRKVLWLLATGLFFPMSAYGKVYQLGLIMAKDRSQTDTEILSAATSAFFDSKRFEVIERARLDTVFTERDLQDFIQGTPGDLSDLEGIDMLGLLSYSEERSATGTKYYIDVRLTMVKTGKIFGTVTSRRDTFGGDPGSPYAAGRHLLENIKEMFPPEGYVIQISGNEVIVDLGKESGLAAGDELEVIRDGEQLFHPITHDPLPAIEQVVGVLKVVKPADQLSTCKFKNQAKDASPVVVTDRVRLRPKNEKARKIWGKLPFVKGKS